MNQTTMNHHEDSVVQLELADNTNVGSEPGLWGTQGSGSQSCPSLTLLVCGGCGKEFGSRQNLKQHIKRNTVQDQKQLSCSLRKKRVTLQSPDESFSCRVCNNIFPTLGFLMRHIKSHNKESGSQCGVCGERLESTELLENHLHSHKELARTCDVCGKKFSSITVMKIHKRVHTGEKPYSCGVCCREFSCKQRVVTHMKVHSGDRPHRCALCRRRFTSRGGLVRHLNFGHRKRRAPPE